MSAQTKTQRECVPNHPVILKERRKKVYAVNNRTQEGYRKRPNLYEVYPRLLWWNRY